MTRPRLPRLLAAAVLGIAAHVAAAAPLAIVGATIYPSPADAPIADATVLVDDGRIVRVGPRAGVPVPASATVIDGRGRHVMAGFWNCHVHLTTPVLLTHDQRPDAEITHELDTYFTRWGFTTVVDLASTMDIAAGLRARVKSGRVTGPAILTVGAPFYPQGGTPIYAREVYEKFHLPSAEITTIDAAVVRLDRQVEEGTDAVKLFTGAIVGGPVGILPMPADQVRALAAEAHRLHRLVFSHPTNRAGLDVAIDNGVDILAHVAPQAGPWDAGVVARLKANHVGLVPTLQLFAEIKDLDVPVETLLQQVQAQASWGGDILFGTDVGFRDDPDPTLEYRLLARVLDWRAILAALTTAPARRFGVQDAVGRVAAGYRADLVVLPGDPTKDATAFARVEDVIEGGRIVHRTSTR